MLGGKGHTRKPVLIDGVIYPTITEAAEAYKVTQSAMTKRCGSRTHRARHLTDVETVCYYLEELLLAGKVHKDKVQAILDKVE